MSLKTLGYAQRSIVIGEFYKNNADRPKSFIVNHFVTNYGLKRTTVYDVLKKIDALPPGEVLKRFLGQGRPKKLSNRQEVSILGSLENKVGASTKKVAGRYDISKSTVQRTLHRRGAKCPKRTAVPNISTEQHVRIKERCGRLARDFFPEGGRVDIVIDDESYFLLKDDH